MLYTHTYTHIWKQLSPSTQSDSFIPKNHICQKMEKLRKANTICKNIKIKKKKNSFKNEIHLLKGLKSFNYTFFSISTNHFE